MSELTYGLLMSAPLLAGGLAFGVAGVLTGKFNKVK